MQMKSVFLTVVAGFSLCGAVVADAAPNRPVLPEKYRHTPAEIRARRAAIETKRFGGRLRKPNSATGKVVFLNGQKSVARADLQICFEEIEARFRIVQEVRDIAEVNPVNPAKAIADAGAQIGVILVDAPDLPPLLVAPEAGWATVNVRAIAANASDAKVVARRVRVEIMRGFGLVAGAAFMGRDQIVLRRDILCASDLDMVQREAYGMEVAAAIEKGLPARGVNPWRISTYRVACEEGWAPAPTNDAQKVIWDEIHSIPTKSLKISYDKDSQKPIVK